jgi:hypothetical protein
MPARVESIHRVMLAIKIRLLVEEGVPRGEQPHLRIVVPRAEVRQPGVAVVAVAGIGGERVRIAAAAGAADLVVIGY